MRAPAPALPLLRSPPFPWIAGDRAAVSSARSLPCDSSDRELLVAACRTSRVGGAFWLPPGPPVRSQAIIIRPRDDAEATAFLRQAGAIGGEDVSIVTMRAEAGQDVDPWSMLRPGVRLIAAADDEWTLIAFMAGAEAVGHARQEITARIAAAIDHADYRDPYTGSSIRPEAAIEILAGWRRTLDANRSIGATSGIAWWKKPQMERFLWTGRHAPLVFSDSADLAVDAARKAGGAVLVWPSRAPTGLAAAAAEAGVEIARVEDGFIRSVGLGADLHPPYSIVVDRRGIYYDPGCPSDLETILATADFPSRLTDRAETLMRQIVAGGISKYASGQSRPDEPPRRESAGRIVLVTGQVEDDQSVRLGGGAVTSNLDLLQRARAAEPDAHLLFKPHPDVDAGHRKGRVPDATMLAYADAIVRDQPMATLLARVDAVHVLTSLAGFEALLRGREVTTHGHPFYAGWGLTRDLAGPLPRRTRRLTLAELVAGTLILYPRYLDPVTELPCPPEVMLRRFADGWRPQVTLLVRVRRWQGRIAKLLGTTTA